MPIGTGRIGFDRTGSAQVYTPPDVQVVTPGSTVTYGPWVTIQEFDALPSAPVILEVDTGSAPLQAINLAFHRTVTIS